MKLKPTQLQKLTRVLDASKVEYVRASVKATDKATGKVIPCTVIMLAAVYGDVSGAYLFSGPLQTPNLPGPNHQHSTE